MSGSDEALPKFAERFKPFEEKLGKVYNPNEVQHEEIRVSEIPLESLLTITRLVAQFLGPSDILSLLTLNKAIYQHLLDEALYAYICAIKLKYTSVDDLTASNVLSHFNSFTGLKVLNNADLFKSIKNAINLVKNPSFENQLNFWDNQPGGTGFGFETVNLFRDRKAALATSYDWCTVSQDINLPGGSDRLIVAGMATNRRVDCGSSVIVKLEADGKEEKLELVLPAENPSYDVFGWVIAKVAIRVGAGTHDLKVSFAGKDDKFWAGNFGARFGYCFVYAFGL